jgi:hypothetical protein
MELIDDGEATAYLYKDKDIEYTKDIFGENWYTILVEMRKLYPDNILTKYMCSSLHGMFASGNTEWKTKQEVIDEELDICFTDQADFKIVQYKNYNFGEKEVYKLLNNEKPYKYNVRLQSFLLSECRNKTASIVMTDIENVIRVHTDNVCFRNIDPKFNIDGLKLEKKTTGLIKWENVNKGLHKCKCKIGFCKYEDMLLHCK